MAPTPHSVAVVVEDGLAAVPATENVVGRARRFHTQLVSHELTARLTVKPKVQKAGIEPFTTPLSFVIDISANETMPSS